MNSMYKHGFGHSTLPMSTDRLIPVFMPSLVSVLLRHEREKGTPLTEEEVLAIRDKSTAVMLPPSSAIEVTSKRGYDDIDPERCWSQWQQVRTQL
jgi:hypothetical protein